MIGSKEWGGGFEDDNEEILNFLCGEPKIYESEGGVTVEYTVNKKKLSQQEIERLMAKALDDTEEFRSSVGLGDFVSATYCGIKNDDGFAVAQLLLKDVEEEGYSSGKISLADPYSDWKKQFLN